MMGGEAAMIVALADSFFFDVDPSGAVRLTRGAASLVRTAEELERAASLWRADRLE